jgi:hypothetical protein
MRIDRAMLDSATARGILDRDQADALWRFLADGDDAQAAVARFRAAHFLYYLGGLIALGAASLFLNLGWEQLGPWGGATIAAAYAAGCWRTAAWLLDERRLPIPAGLVAALVPVCAPIVVYGLQQALGWWPEGHDAYRDYHRWADWHWWFMELATLAVGAATFLRYRLPILTLPIAVTLWYVGMDIALVLTGGTADAEFVREAALLFGLATLLLAFWIDLRQRGPLDHAFWLYLFGLLGFWGALTATPAGSELARLGYCLVNIALMVAGVVLARRPFVVFGALGFVFYLGHLAHDVFADSLGFPFVLTLLGLGLVAAGIAWQRHEAALEARLRPLLPARLARAIECRGG